MGIAITIPLAVFHIDNLFVRTSQKENQQTQTQNQNQSSHNFSFFNQTMLPELPRLKL